MPDDDEIPEWAACPICGEMTATLRGVVYTPGIPPVKHSCR